ncbi:MAG: tetratricopeptide repeat protein [Candidatus Latescibacteria bacterium]|nr:tetratricopeptide repeat protein [Candidatus Latescibacterota bacterium]
MKRARELTVILQRHLQRYKVIGCLWVGTGLLALGALSCGQQEPDQLFAAAEAAAADSAQLGQAAEQFEDFLGRFPQHGRSPEAVKHLARIAQQQGDMEGAISYYRRLLEKYPDSPFCPEAQFMIAFIYEEHLDRLDQARAAYRQVIDNYPDSELAVSARRLLPHVGRDPEEWVEFQDEASSL